MGEEVKGNEETSENQSDNMTEEEKKEANKEVFQQIVNNYDQLNQMMVEEMNMASLHDGLTGNYREEMWVKFFRSIIPRKYSLAQGVMIIDSKGSVSKEVDIAVYDEQYTPYVFQYNTLRFIPIEAVVVVIECKSASLNVEMLKTWSESISGEKGLCTKASGIARIVQGYSTGLTNDTQIKTRPVRILASIKQSKTDKPLENIQEELGGHFDFIIQQKITVNEKKFEVMVPKLTETLNYWAKELNGNDDGNKNLKLLFVDNSKYETQCNNHEELTFEGEKRHLTNTLKDLEIPENPLLSLNFQLNQLLMLINNPMLFPHFAYAKAFRDIASEMKEKERAEKDHKTNEQKAKK